MDRETLAQAVAMLIVLALLMRWLPPGQPDDALGRGDPWRAISIDRSLLQEPAGSEQGGAQLRALFRRELAQRWQRLLLDVRRLQAQVGPADVVQLRGLSRNEVWPIAYDLYPARVLGRGFDEGEPVDAPVSPTATWVLTAQPSTDRVTLQPGPAAGADASGGPPR